MRLKSLPGSCILKRKFTGTPAFYFVDISFQFLGACRGQHSD